MKRARTRSTYGFLVGAGAAVMLIIILLLQSFIGLGLFGTRTVSVTVTTSDPYEQVSDAYASHLMHLNARNINALASEYQSNATAEWIGPVQVGVGNYSGAREILMNLASFVGKFNSNFSLSNEYQSIGKIKGSDSWMVNSTFDIQGTDAAVGNVDGTVNAQDSYVHVNATWLIAWENWNFTRFNSSPLGT